MDMCPSDALFERAYSQRKQTGIEEDMSETVRHAFLRLKQKKVIGALSSTNTV
jgi:hypothetical protein